MMRYFGLLECYCAATVSATADRDEFRNPKRFIHVALKDH